MQGVFFHSFYICTHICIPVFENKVSKSVRESLEGSWILTYFPVEDAYIAKQRSWTYN